MSRTWCVLDMHNLAYRALFTSGGLSHEGVATGVIFGLLRDISNFGQRFGTTDFAFTFDHGKGLREQQFPYYKATRRKRNLTEEEETARQEMRDQLDRLRTEYLDRLGYGNVFWQKGYEADDLMAAVVAALPPGDRAVLVTSDKDVWQLLSRQVAVLTPHTHELFTARHFRRLFGIDPAEWVRVKALAGCSSDDIPGCPGVGEKTAVAYLKGEIKDNKKWRDIKAYKSSPAYAEALQLVRLPYRGLKPVELEDRTPDRDGLRELLVELGMKSLIDQLGLEKTVRGPVR